MAFESALYRLVPEKIGFLLCEVQKYKPAIPVLKALSENTAKLLAAGKALGVPSSLRRALSREVCELDIGHACANVAKTKFSILVDPQKHGRFFGPTLRDNMHIN